MSGAGVQRICTFRNALFLGGEFVSPTSPHNEERSFYG